MADTWQLKRVPKVTSREVLRDVLLEARGIAPHEADSFFAPQWERDVGDYQAIVDLPQAVARITQALARGERILVYGDYDADGITGTAILASALRERGGEVLPYLPHRLEDGYGLSARVLSGLEREFDLLITVDCGVSNAPEIEHLNALGKDTIVVDHHMLPAALPPAYAVLHPGRGDYTCRYLSGAGMAWKLAQALLGAEDARGLLDLACIGTVADMVPLLGENRMIAHFGLPALRRSRRPGIQLLLEAVGEREVTTEFIAYRIAPLLNAAGRMEHPQPALDFLLTRDPTRARELLDVLTVYNQSRRTLSRRIQREAEEGLGLDQPIIFAYNTAWPAGLVGLVAGRLSDKFSRLAVVVGSGSEHAVGSVRAPAGIDVMAHLGTARDHMLKLGGHASAAGFSVTHDNVDMLRQVLLRGSESLSQERTFPRTEADAVIDEALLDWETWEMLQYFQPYGEGNARPALVLRDVPVASWRPVGKDSSHAKLDFVIADRRVGGIGFGLAQEDGMRAVRAGSLADVVFHLDCNEWQGRRSLQLLVQDIAPAGTVQLVSSPPAGGVGCSE
ncbi:MAG TPA: single-stranded-DNA-specific exonuclease RecJ [Candidatus Andersenbacteria bacterium]|nr:single-stranded-DNA-specific exonuclease RecJ [Candidatus Andersenbacteria bacterium]